MNEPFEIGDFEMLDFLVMTGCVYVLAGTASANSGSNRKNCRNNFESTLKDAFDEIVEAYWGVIDRIK